MVTGRTNANWTLNLPLDTTDINKFRRYHSIRIGTGKGFQGLAFLCYRKFPAFDMLKMAWAPTLNEDSDIIDCNRVIRPI